MGNGCDRAAKLCILDHQNLDKVVSVSSHFLRRSTKQSCSLASHFFSPPPTPSKLTREKPGYSPALNRKNGFELKFRVLRIMHSLTSLANQMARHCKFLGQTGPTATFVARQFRKTFHPPCLGFSECFCLTFALFLAISVIRKFLPTSRQLLPLVFT